MNINIQIFYAYLIVLNCLWYAEFDDSLLLFIYQVFYSFSFFDFKRLGFFFKHKIKFKKNNFINYHKCAKVTDWVPPHNYRCCHNTLFSLTSIWAAEQLTISRMLSMYETIFAILLLNDWTNGRKQMEICFKSPVVVTIHMEDAYLFDYVDCLTVAVHIFFDTKCRFDLILSSSFNYKVLKNYIY